MAGGERKGSALTEQMDHEEQQQEADRLDLVEGVRSGETTTGNELHDQLIRWRGVEAFDERLVKFYEHANEAITGRSGEPFAITISDTARSESRGCPGIGEVIDGYDYVVYGILTGEPLQLKDGEQGLAVPTVDWVQYSAVAKKVIRSHSSSSMDKAYIEYIKNQLEEADSDALPLVPFEQAGVIHKMQNPDLHIAAGNEQIEEALMGCQHMPIYNSELALSIAELHELYEYGKPMPSFCKSELTIARHSAEETIQKREEALDNLRAERRQLQTQVEEIDDKIEEASAQQARDGEWLQRIVAAQEFFSESADHSPE